MGFIIFAIIAVSGALIGGIAGGLVTGYLVIFKSMAHIASMADPAQWTKLFEGVMILLFTKTLVIVGAVSGGLFCAIPGMIGMAKYSEDN
jgi:hypothetical protein